MNARIHQFEPSILRQYDIRGTWGENLSENDAILLAEKITEILLTRKNNSENNSENNQHDNCKNYCALLARDGRASGRMLMQGLILGFQKYNIQAIDLGLLPTPALYFAESYMRENIDSISENIGENINEVLCAIMVTGSHNPPQQNGFKIVVAGRPFFGQDIQKLARKTDEIAGYVKSQVKNKSQNNNKNQKIRSDMLAQYLAQLLREDQLVKGGDIQAVWDAGGGASAEVLKTLLPKLAGEHSLLFGDIDPSFKARSPDPAKPRALEALRLVLMEKKELAKKEQAKKELAEKELAKKAEDTQLKRCVRIGLAFDGDGDRLLVMLENGSVLMGDRLLLLFAEDLIKNHKKNSSRKSGGDSAPIILCDIKTSPSILQRIRDIGGLPKLVPTGHANIKHAINELGADMAGEVSGHLFFNDRYRGYDDAIYAAVRLCAMLRGGFSIEKTLASLPPSVSSGELRLPIEEVEKFILVKKIRQKLEHTLKHMPKHAASYSLCTLDGIRLERELAWCLLRASNTEPAIVLRIEADSEKNYREMRDFLAQMLAQCGFANPQKIAQAEIIYS